MDIQRLTPKHVDHDQFSLGIMLGHGAVQGLFTALRGGKFKTGFISGMASKGISAIMRGTSLSKADPFVKMSVTAVLSGMASKASGGDFVQGAMSAMVVWLYNDMADYIKRQNEGRANLADTLIDNSKISIKERKKIKIRALSVLGDCTKEHYLGIAGGGAMTVSGLPIVSKTKAAGAFGSTKKTSYLSTYLRSTKWGSIKMGTKIPIPPTIIRYRGITKAVTYGGFAGRAIPLAGEVILIYDTVSIGTCCVSKY